MTLKKWNYIKHDYDDYNIPDNWHVSTLELDLNTIINCVQCGKEVKYGDTYTSLEVHTPLYGFGYCVCKKCYNEEWERRKKYRDE